MDEAWAQQVKTTMQAAILDVGNNPDLKTCIQKGVHALGGVVFRRGGLVAIKPNLTTAKSAEGSGITTPVDITEAVIRLINEQTDGDCRIVIVESDSDGRIQDTYQALGYQSLVQKFANVELVDLGTEPVVKVVMPDWSKVRMLEVPEILMSVDHLVNIANLKRHIQERVTLNWKNVYGLPSNHLVRQRYHQFMKEIMLDLHYLFWPDLAVIDARVGLGGTGPMSGFPVPFGHVIVGANPLATDMAALRLIGEPLSKVASLAYAAKTFKVKASDLTIVGDPWSPRPLPFVNDTIYRAVRFGLWVRRGSTWCENLSLLSWLVGIALRMGKPADFAGGGVQSLGTSLRVAWRMLTTIDLSEKVYE